MTTTYSIIDKTTKQIKKDDDDINLTVDESGLDWLYAVEGSLNNYKSNGRYYILKNSKQGTT